MTLPVYPKHEYLSHGLTQEQAEDPHSVLAAFFDMAHITSQREYLRQILEVMTVGNWTTISQRDKENIMYYYGRLEKLIEIAHVLHLSRPSVK